MVASAEAGPLYGMMLPTLISLSVAPGSYFFCARALDAAKANPTIAVAVTTKCLTDMRTSFGDWLTRTLRGGAVSTPYFVPRKADSTSYPHRHDVHEPDQENAVNRPGSGLGKLVGDVGH